MSAGDIQQEHQRRLHAIDERYGARVTTCQTSVDRLQGEWNEIKASVWDRLPRYSSPLFYWPFMTLLAVAEAPLNRLSFELFFTESPLVSFGVALLCGLVLIALAHFFGLGICRFRYDLEQQRKVTGNRSAGANIILKLLVLAGLIFALCYGIAILRQGYLTFALGPDSSFSDLLEAGEYSEAAALVLGASLKVEGLIFLVINLAVVSVGVFAAILCHDAHPDYERIDRELNSARKDLAFNQRLHGEARAKEEARYAAEQTYVAERDQNLFPPTLPNYSD